MKIQQKTKRASLKSVILLVSLFASIPLLQAQVGIDVASPSSAAVLDLNVPDKDKGILIPRVNTTDWETRITPVDGLLVYDENQKMFYYYDGGLSEWQAVNPFTYRKGSNSVDETDFVLPVGNGRRVVIGTTGGNEEIVEVRGRLETTGNVSTASNVVATGTVSATGNISTSAVFEGFGTIPLGGIIMWSGTSATVPSGWALCDGTVKEGYQTPDLTGRFVVGYQPGNADYDQPGNLSTNGTPKVAGNTGGLSAVTLVINEMPSHNHAARTTSNGAHEHYLGSRGFETNGTQGADPSTDDNTITTHGGGAHGHTIEVDPTGGGAPHENRPPYYVLAFIMRVK